VALGQAICLAARYANRLRGNVTGAPWIACARKIVGLECQHSGLVFELRVAATGSVQCPLQEAVCRAFFRIEPDMDAELARTLIEQTLTMLALRVAEHLATLADFLGCAEPTSRAIDPATRRTRLRAMPPAPALAASTGCEPAHALPAP
jgi:hypothetical protein